MYDLGLSWLLGRLFDDKRATIMLVAMWGVITVVTFWQLGAFHIQFMTFGPSKDTQFLGMLIDTWPKWMSLAVFSFVNTAINEFLGNALVPFITNTIEDHKTKYIPYSKMTCLFISQMHTIYCHIMGTLSLLMFFCQVDFLLVRLVADLIVNHYAVFKFLADKEHDAGRYKDIQNSYPLLAKTPPTERDGDVDDVELGV